MFDYTKTAVNKIGDDFKKFFYRYQIVAQLVYIAYLIYALVQNKGAWYVNGLLLLLSAAYFVFFVVATRKEAKSVLKKRVKRVFTECKRLIKFYTLCVMLYGVWQTATDADPLSVVLSALMIVGWVLQILFEVILKFFLDKANFLLEAAKADAESIAKPVKNVGNFFKRVTGQEVEERKEPTKHRLLLNEMVEKYREKRKAEKEEKKRRKKQDGKNAKLEKRQAKRTAKNEKRQAKRTRKAEKRAAKTNEKIRRRNTAPLEETAIGQDDEQKS